MDHEEEQEFMEAHQVSSDNFRIANLATPDIVTSQALKKALKDEDSDYRASRAKIDTERNDESKLLT